MKWLLRIVILFGEETKSELNIPSRLKTETSITKSNFVCSEIGNDSRVSIGFKGEFSNVLLATTVSSNSGSQKFLFSNATNFSNNCVRSLIANDPQGTSCSIMAILNGLFYVLSKS